MTLFSANLRPLRWGVAVLLALLLAGRAWGQAAPPAPPTALLPPAQVPGSYRAYLTEHYAADARALAVVRLFGRRQRGGRIWAAGGAAAVGGLLLAGRTYRLDANTTVQLQPSTQGALALLLAGPPLGVGVSKLVRFSDARLYAALQAYDEGQPLPKYVARRLQGQAGWE